jgi:hypothetical protein
VGDHTATAPDAGVIEQQMDHVGIVAIRHLFSELLYLRCVGDVGHMPCEAQAMRQPSRFTERVRLRHPRRREVAHRDVAPFRNQLAHKFPPHSRAAAGNDSSPAREIFHGRNLA